MGGRDQRRSWRRRKIGGITPGTVDIRTTTSADDGWWSSGGINTSHADNIVGEISGTVYHCFSRFPNVTIPAGATADTSYITVEAPNDNTADGAGVKTNMYMNDADDATAPTTVGEAAGKALTTAFTAWDDQTFSDDTPTNSGSMNTAIQEVLDRGGWSSGQAMMLIWRDDGSSTSKFYRLKSSDWDSPNLGFILHVEYS